MRTIIGRAGKSKLLELEMKSINKEEILLVDMIGVLALHELAAYLVQPNSYPEMIEVFSHLEKNEEFEGVKYIALEINTKIEEVDFLLKWERRLKRKFLVTVQDNDIERVMVIEMSLPY